MVTPLEIKRKKVELLRVSAAKAELELRIHERMEEVERLQEHIKVSEAKETELAQLIQDMEKEVKQFFQEIQMSDINSGLPIRTQVPSQVNYDDVVVKI